MVEVNGLVSEVQRVPRGSELVTAATIGATVLSVDSAEDFDDAGGDLDVNGVGYVYVSCEIDTDTITLAAPGLTAAAAVGDSVAPVAGGQIMVDHMAYVTLGEGDPAEVEIPYADRTIWPEGVYVEPIPVVLSADLTAIVEVPGRMPIIDGATLQTGQTGPRVVIRTLPLPDMAGIVEFYSGIADEIPGSIAAGVSVGGLASIDITPPTKPGDAQTPFVGMSSGSATPGVGASRLDLSAAAINTSGDITGFGSMALTGSIHGFDIYADSQTGVGTVGASLTAQGRLTRTPSTRKAKKNIKRMPLNIARQVLDLVPVTFRLKAEKDGPTYPGFIAEQAAEVADLWVTRDANGEPDGFRYGEVTAALVALAKDQAKRIDKLERQVAALAARHTKETR